MMINRRSFSRMSLATMVMAGLAVGGVQLTTDDDSATAARVTRVETLDVTDLSNDRRLVGLADNVFVGKVLMKVGETAGTGPDETLPETQFSVEVIRAIKGSLSGTVTVNQQGGFRSPEEQVLVEGDALVEPGQTYLFVTRTNPETGWHTLVPVHGDVKVRGDSHRQDLERRFTNARGQQIPFNAAE